MAGQLGSVSIDLEARIAKFESDMGRAARLAQREAEKMRASIERQTAQINARFNSIAATAKGVVAGLAGSIGIQQFAGLIKGSLDAADSLSKLEQKTGITADKLSGLAYAGRLSGVSFEGLQSGLQKFARSVDDAARGGSKAQQVFSAMGISTRDSTGNVRALDAILGDVATRFASYKDDASKAAAAQALFGRGGAELIPLLNLGAAGIERMRKQAEALGLVFDTNAAKAAEQFNDNVEILRLQVEGFSNVILKRIVPSLAAYTDGLVRSAESGRGLVAQGEMAGDWLKKFAVGLVIAKNTVDLLADSIGAIASLVVAHFTAAADTIGAFADFAKSAVQQLTNPLTSTDIEKAGRQFNERMSDVAKDLVASYSEAGKAINKSITEGVSDVFDAYEAFSGAGAKVAETMASVGKKADGAAPSVGKLANAQQEAAKTARAAENAQRALARRNQQDMDSSKRWETQLDRFNQKYQDVLQSYRDEIQLLGMSEEQRTRYAAALEAENAIREMHRENVEQNLRVGAEELAQNEQMIRQLAAQTQAAREQAEIASQYRGAWTNAIGQVSTAWGDWIARGFKDTKSMLASVKNAFKQWVADMFAIALQRSLMQAFFSNGGGTGGGSGGWMQMAASMFGGGGGGGSGGGWMQMAASMFGGGGGAASAGGGAGGMNWMSLLGSGGSSAYAGFGSLFTGTPTAVNSVGPLAGGYAYPGASSPALGGFGTAVAGIGGAIYGYNRTNGGAAGIGAAASYGALGIGLAGTAAGVAAGAGLTAAAGGAFASLGAAAAIPVVGWVLAALALVDLISGGKLFGTKYQIKDLTSTIAVGSEGGVAGLVARETRQRALFGGTQTRYRSLDVSQEQQDAADQVYDAARGMLQQASRRLRIELPQVVSGSFMQLLDKKGKLKEEWSEVLGKKYKEDFEAFQKRIQAEQVIAAVGALDSSASMLAEKYRANADTLVDAANAFLSVQSDIVEGVAFLGTSSTLTGVVTLVEDLKNAGEGLGAAYERIKTATKLYDQALSMAGISLDKTREDIVRFATAISEAAGGIDQASALWTSYFDNFYTEQERALRSLETLTAERDKQLAGIGLTGGVDNAGFREAFEAALPTLTPEQVVDWLRAGQAITQATAALAQYAQTLGLSATALTSYTAFVASLNEALDPRPMSQYQQAVAAIQVQQTQLIAEANRLARAQGMEAAATEDLARIHLLTARRLAEAQRVLMGQIRDVIAELQGGTPLDQVNSQIALMEEQKTAWEQQRDAYYQQQEAARAAYEEQLRGIQALRDQARDMLLGDLSPLSGRQKVSEGLRQLMEAQARGDAARVGQVAQTVLQVARAAFASGADYNRVFNTVQGVLNGFGNNIRPPNGSGGPGPGSFDQGTLDRLYAERDRILAEQEALHRSELREILQGYIADLAFTTGKPLAEIAAELGMSLPALAELLGTSVDGLLELLNRVLPAGQVIVESTPMPDGTVRPGVRPPNAPSTSSVSPASSVTTAAAPAMGATAAGGGTVETQMVKVLSDILSAIRATPRSIRYQQ